MTEQEREEGKRGSQKENFKEKFATMREAVRRGWLPMALSIGVGYQEFWGLNPAGLEPYIRAYEMMQRRRMEEMNFQSYLTGIYFTHALGCVFSQNNRYPEGPFDIFSENLSPEERAQQEAEIFRAYVQEYNTQLGKEKK